MTASGARIRHFFTVDVEEYFQVVALAPHVSRADWDAIPSRVELGTRLILDLMAEAGARCGTFLRPWLELAERHSAVGA